jgi:hypothetical protein
MTFGIAGGWICREDANAYTWFLNKLKTFVFPSLDCQPSVFITDEDIALMQAIDVMFPGTPTMLCYIHLLRNFRKAIRKLFHGSKKYSLAESAFYGMVHCRDEDGFTMHYNDYITILKRHIIHPQTGLSDMVNVEKATTHINL